MMRILRLLGRSASREPHILRVPSNGEMVWSPAEEHSRLRPFGETAREYGTELGCHLTLTSPSNQHSDPGPPPALHIHLFAVPTIAHLLQWGAPRATLPPPGLFGLPTPPGGVSLLAPTGNIFGGRVFSDPSGWPVAELIGTNIYLLPNLLAWEEATARLLFRKFLDVTLEPSADLLERITSRRRHRLKLTLEHLRRGTEREELHLPLPRHNAPPIETNPEREQGWVAAEIERLEGQIRRYSQRIEMEERRQREFHRRLETLKHLVQDEKGVGAELERLRSMPEVREVELEDGCLTVFTNPIHVTYNGKRYLLGSFRINLDLDGGNLRIVNLTNPYKSYDHPHIDMGRPCLGNLQGWIFQLLGERQFATAAQLLMEYLKTVTPADWRKSIIYWEEAPLEKEEG